MSATLTAESPRSRASRPTPTDRVAALHHALQGAAEVDPEARALHQKWEHERREGMLNGPVPIFLAEGVLRPDRTPDEIADLWSMLVGPPLYYQLVAVAGWSHDRFAAWLADTMERLLLVPR